MRRKLAIALLVLCCLVLVAGAVVYRLYGFRTHLTVGGTGLASHPPPEVGARGELASLPRYDPDSLSAHQVRLQGWDLRGLDLSGRLPDLLQANFDTHTQWPEELPDAFDPERSMELGKNPGLGLRALHERGITGRGVSIGIIDHRLLVEHAEFSDRLRLYEELHSFEPKASMHGTAVASIAVGKTVGVAPEADLYYISSFWMTSNPIPWARALSRVVFAELISRKKGETAAEPEMGWEMVDFVWAGRAIERLLDLNRDLPAARKIRVISIEVGWAPGQPGYEEAMAAVERAKEEGVFVISSCLRDTHGLQFHGLGREPLNALRRRCSAPWTLPPRPRPPARATTPFTGRADGAGSRPTSRGSTRSRVRWTPTSPRSCSGRRLWRRAPHPTPAQRPRARGKR